MAKSKLRFLLKKVVTVVVTLTVILTILLIGLIISQFLQSNEFSFISIAITASFIGISLLIANQTHHLGHFLVGNIFHYQLVSYHFQDISMIPVQKRKNAHRQIWYYASGILCNLILGISLLLVVCLAPLGLPTLAWLFLFTLSMTLVVTAILQAISYYNEGIPTDGKVLWGLLFHSDFSNYYVATTNLLGALKAELRPAQIPMHSYKEDAVLQSSDAILVLYLYYKALDLQKAPIMVKYIKMLENNFDIIPQHLQPTVICELCHAYTLMGLDKAKSYFSLMKKLPPESRSLCYYRACAYYFYYYKEDRKQALTAVSYAIEAFSSCEFSGMLAMEQSLLQTLITEISDNL